MSADRHTQYIHKVKRWKKKAGKAHYIRFLEGKNLTRDEAIQARCYDCVCGEDTELCLSTTCSLVLFCPWNKPKKATASNLNINSSDALHSVPQNIPDQLMAEED